MKKHEIRRLKDLEDSFVVWTLDWVSAIILTIHSCSWFCIAYLSSYFIIKMDKQHSTRITTDWYLQEYIVRFVYGNN